MKGKNGVKLADFIREMINTKISEKPVKSRIFEDFEGIKNAPPRLLLRLRYNGHLGKTSYRIQVRVSSGLVIKPAMSQ